MEKIKSEIIDNGFVIVDAFFDNQQIIDLENSLFQLGAFDYENSQIGSSSLLELCKPVRDLANDAKVKQLLRELCKEEMFPVKAFILDKTSVNNWEIPWHQDLKIAVDNKRDLHGYTDWSVEADIVHVQPPREVMSKLITLRLHLDSCDETNGAIHVIPGSHTLGIIPKNEISTVVESSPKRLCSIRQHGVMFMNPLILHDSPPSVSNKPRRILQIEYGYELRNGLTWHKTYYENSLIAKSKFF